MSLPEMMQVGSSVAGVRHGSLLRTFILVKTPVMGLRVNVKAVATLITLSELTALVLRSTASCVPSKMGRALFVGKCQYRLTVVLS
jgi:hypothetical protein